jgi:hypothetical protein
MTTNQFDFNKFNTLVNQASDSILGNTEYQTQRQSEKLKQTYLNTQINANNIETEEQLAEKKYIIFTQGEDAYNTLLEKRLQAKSKLIVDKFSNVFYEEINKIKTQLQTYNGILVNVKNIIDLLTSYKKENRELLKELKEDTNDVLTNERKTFYEDQYIGSLKGWIYYVLLIVYIACILYFMFISQTWMKKIIVLIIFAILPLLLNVCKNLFIFLFRFNKFNAHPPS